MARSLRSAWKRQPVGVRRAIINGVSALLVLILGGVGTVVWWYVRKTPDVIITDLRVASSDSKPGVDVFLWNRSEVPQPVTSLHLSLSQEEVPPAVGVVGQRVYELTGEIAVRSTGKGSIEGSVRPLGTLREGEPISYPASGCVFIDGGGKWSVSIILPVREEIPAEQSLSLVLILPGTFGITAATQGALAQGPLKQYTSGSPPKDFSLSRLLWKGGRVQASATVTYSDKRVTAYRQLVWFPRDPEGRVE